MTRHVPTIVLDRLVVPLRAALAHLFPSAPELPPEPPIGHKWRDGGLIGEQPTEDILAQLPRPGERAILKGTRK